MVRPHDQILISNVDILDSKSHHDTSSTGRFQPFSMLSPAGDVRMTFLGKISWANGLVQGRIQTLGLGGANNRLRKEGKNAFLPS